MESVPFSLDLGVTTVQGVLRLEPHDLVIEWRRYDLMDAPRGNLETLRVPYARLRGVEFVRRAVGSRIVVTADAASVFAELPLPSGDLTALRATVRRRHRADASAWAAEAGLRVAEAEEPPAITDA